MFPKLTINSPAVVFIRFDFLCADDIKYDRFPTI